MLAHSRLLEREIQWIKTGTYDERGGNSKKTAVYATVLRLRLHDSVRLELMPDSNATAASRGRDMQKRE